MSDGAPVCNLPNRGQVPALQSGRLFPAVPKAQDLPSAIQAINALAQIIMELAGPGLPQFQNNLAPYSRGKPLSGTRGIGVAQGGGGSFAMDGQDGLDAEAPSWVLNSIITEKTKVTNPDDEDQYVVVKRIKSITFVDRVSEDNASITFTMT